MIDLFQLSIIAILIFSFLIVFYITILPNLMEIRDIPQMLEDFLSNETLPDLMQGATGAILGILLAFYVGIILERLTGNTLQNNHLQKLDISVIMDHVYPFPKALIIIATSLILPMFMVISNVYWQLFLFIIWGTTFRYIIYGIQKIYHWIKGEKNDYRIQYLDSIKRHTNTEHWDSVWKSESLYHSNNLYHSNKYLNTFQDTINTILRNQEKQELEKLPYLLNSFLKNNQNIHRINYFIYNDQFMNNLFSWDNQLWRSELLIEDHNQFHWIMVSQSNIDDIIDMILKTLITNTCNIHIHSLFSKIDEALQNLKDDYVSKKDNKEPYYYYKYISHIFAKIIKYGEKNPNYDRLWSHRIPKEWKVTEENWKTNRISQLLISEFVYLLVQGYYHDQKGFNSYVEYVNDNLFPYVNKKIWSRAIHLYIKKSIIDVVQNPPNFGERDSTQLSPGIKEYPHERKQNTINLALLIFGNTLFTETNIRNWINELENYTPSNKKEEQEKTMWRDFLREMQDKVSNHYE